MGRNCCSQLSGVIHLITSTGRWQISRFNSGGFLELFNDVPSHNMTQNVISTWWDATLLCKGVSDHLDLAFGNNLIGRWDPVACHPQIMWFFSFWFFCLGWDAYQCIWHAYKFWNRHVDTNFCRWDHHRRNKRNLQKYRQFMSLSCPNIHVNRRNF